MTTPLASHGTLVAFQATPGGAFADIAELGDITFPEFSRTEADASIQNMGIDRYIQSNLLRRSPLMFTVNYIPSDTSQDFAAGLGKLMKDNTVTGFRITFPDGGTTVWVISGQVNKIAPKPATVDGKLTADITIRPSGAMTIGATTLS